MKEEDAKKIFKEKEISHIPQYKKFWYSITKFERYPEMATEGVGRAFKYLAWLIFMFAIMLAFALTIKSNIIAKEGIKYLDENFSKIDYKDGVLSVETTQNDINTDVGRVIINTDELTSEQIKKYENETTRKPQFIWLRDRVMVKYGDNGFGIYYKDVLDNTGLKNFDKAYILNSLINVVNRPKTYVAYGIMITIYVFISYFIAVLIDVLVLSVFGILTSFIAKLQMRYRAVFNMSVYAITLSTVLQLIYNLVRLFTDFNIKYFDLMHTAISFICLVAAIFMIKSDVIRQQMELMKVIQIKRKEQQQEEEEKKEEKKKEKENSENEEEKDKEEKKEKKGEKEKSEPDIEGQGSNA